MTLAEWIQETQRAIDIDRAEARHCYLNGDIQGSYNCADMALRRVCQLEEALLQVDELLWPALLEVRL